MKPTLLLLFILAVITCHAQTDTSTVRSNKRSIGFNIGLAHYRMMDEGLSFSKLHYRGTVFNGHLDYSSKATRHWFFASFDAGTGKVKSKEAGVESELLNVELLINYAWRFRYPLFGKKQELFAGLEFGSTIYYLNCPDLDNEDVLTLNGLYITLMQNIALGRSRNLQVKLMLPTVGFVKRVYADGGVNIPGGYSVPGVLYDDSEFTFLSTMQFSASYTKAITPMTDFSATYRFKYLSNNMGELLRLYSNELNVGFKFYFRK